MFERVTRREVLLGSSALAFSLPLARLRAANGHARFGINLTAPADWNSEQPFANAFRMSRPWISQRSGAGWGQGPELALDELGWVTRLDRDCYAETFVCNVSDGRYPSGRYTILYDGAGELRLSNNARRVSADDGKLVVDVDSERSIGLSIVATDPNDYVRNIRVLMPGHESVGEQELYRTDFLQRWQGVASIRFMDWMQTNGSTIEHWSQRPTTQHATYSELGVALESMLDLANEQNADPWFCMPHAADDDYVRQFARVVGERLKPELRAWVEFSNEVWNSQFRQHHYSGARGQELGFARRPWEAAWRYTGYRSKQIFDIWESELGAGKFVRVLASQAVSTTVSEEVLGFQNAFRSADVLAIAPYFSCNVSQSGDGLTTSVVQYWDVDRLFDYMESTALPKAIASMNDQKKIADRFGMKLVAYEAGQHMVGVLGGENNEQVTALFHAANADPRMGELYERYYAAWTEAGGDLMCAFSSVGDWSKWGSWGLMRYASENPAEAPKYRASVEWARSRGQSMIAL